MQRNSYAHVNSFSRAQKSFLCAYKSLYFFLLFFIFYFRDSVGCHFKINSAKKYLHMTVLYTKYKAENNALLTIYAKYSL